MNDKIKWNYNMREVPMDQSLILISDGRYIWSVYYQDNDHIYDNWPAHNCQCEEGYHPDANFIAWSYIDLPKKEDDQTKAYVVALEFAWDNWVEKYYLEKYDASTMPQQYAAEIENAIRRLVEHYLHKSRITRIVAPKKRLRYE